MKTKNKTKKQIEKKFLAVLMSIFLILNLIPTSFALDELGTYIEENRHLPNMEKEKYTGQIEVGKLSEMNLEKIEELSLYILELKNENNAKQSQIDALKQTLCEMGREEWC